MTQHRDIAPEVCAAIAYHEAGHAVANVLAYRNAQLPPSNDIPSVKYAASSARRMARPEASAAPRMSTGGEYVAQLPTWRWGDAMQWQIVIDMAGGVAEAIHRGERRQREVFWFALINCGTDGDLENAEAVCADLRR